MPITKNLVSQDVSNLLSLPESYTKPEANTTFSVGDTHGNAIVLIRYLYEAGIININQNQYEQLIAIYEIDSASMFSKLNSNLCEKFREIVKNGFADADIPEGIHLRWFGDMLADRGSNDILSLIVLDELQKRFPMLRRTILMSNHDKCFLSNYLAGNLNENRKLVLELQPCNSLIRMKQLIDSKTKDYSAADVAGMLKTAYLPALKLVDYVLDGENGIDIMAHAPITLDTIHKAMIHFLPLSEHLNIYESVEKVALILDKLNEVFVKGLKEPKSLIIDAIVNAPSASPLNAFIWPRLEEIKNTKPANNPNYKVKFRHGHDGEPGETIIHGMSYRGYNSILGKMTPKQWENAAIAHLTLSRTPVVNKADINNAINEVIGTHMVSTNLIMQAKDDSEQQPSDEDFIIIDKETVNNKLQYSSGLVQQELLSVQCLATLLLNQYINTRGSYTNSKVGDEIWTAFAGGRNVVFSFFGAKVADVPQVTLAKQLKQSINAMTDCEQGCLALRKNLELTKDLPHSKEYSKVVAEIAKAFNESGLLPSCELTFKSNP